MKLLFWVPPWPSQDDPLFFKNCTQKFLIPQANMLRAHGHEVDFVLPDVLADLGDLLKPGVRKVSIPDAVEAYATQVVGDIYTHLYQGSGAGELTELLRPVLAESYDAVFLWENPAPFLEALFPAAPILHQMPGAYARDPYPSTITVDPVGLYKTGLLYREAKAIQSMGGELGSESHRAAAEFVDRARSIIEMMDDSQAQRVLTSHSDHESYRLLPLQITKHYAFRCDTGLDSQFELLTKALAQTDPKVGLVVTQYVHRLVSEKVLTADVAAALQRKHPNLIFDEAFDRADSVSQKLMSHVDSVETAASSLGLQAMGWGRDLTVRYDTFLKPFSSDQPVEGVSWDERCRNTTAFLLSRYQPMAERMKSDAVFVTAYLDRLITWKRDGLGKACHLPSFDEVDSEYWTRLMQGFQSGISAKSGRDKDANYYLARFRDDVRAASVVSFDIFDTLVRRPMEKPGDLYKFLEAEVYRATDGRMANFARIRSACEQACREEQKGKDFDEITLDQIYDHVRDHYQIDEASIEKVKQLEIEMEVACCTRREFGMKLLKTAMAEKASIYLISDMYLPREVIDRILARNGIDMHKKLYLSADLGLRKHDGRLFDHVLEDLMVKGPQVLHVGDNKNNDAVQAESRDIRVLHWPAAIEKMRLNKAYKSVYQPRNGAGHRARSALAGLTANALFDEANTALEFDSLFAGEPEKLGYAALGPIFTGYVSWIKKQAERDGISDLFFFSREGFVLHEVYRALFGDDDTAPKAHYFYTSRRCVRVAALRQEADIIALASQPYDPGVQVGKLFAGRFAIDLSDAAGVEVLARHGFSGAEQEIKNDNATKFRFIQLCTALSKEILANAAEEREAYEAYIAGSGYLDCKAPGVVDVGWQANIQGALAELTGRKAVGYYYATTSEAILWTAKGHEHRSYLGDYITEATSPSAVVRNRHLFEYLTCHTDPTLIRFAKEGQSVQPVFKLEINRHDRKAFIGRVHRGAVRFARDYVTAFGKVSWSISLDPNLCEGVFANFVNHPSKADRRLLESCQFEDLVGGIEGKSIAPKAAARPAPASSRAAQTREGEGAMLALVFAIEARIVPFFVSGNKLAKYERVREKFFRDSRVPMGWWLRVTGE